MPCQAVLRGNSNSNDHSAPIHSVSGGETHSFLRTLTHEEVNASFWCSDDNPLRLSAVITLTWSISHWWLFTHAKNTADISHSREASFTNDCFHTRKKHHCWFSHTHVKHLSPMTVFTHAKKHCWFSYTHVKHLPPMTVFTLANNITADFHTLTWGSFRQGTRPPAAQIQQTTCSLAPPASSKHCAVAVRNAATACSDCVCVWVCVCDSALLLLQPALTVCKREKKSKTEN